MGYYEIEPSVSVGQLDNWTQLYSLPVRRRLMADLHNQVEALMGGQGRSKLQTMADILLKNFLLTPALPSALGIMGTFSRSIDGRVIFVEVPGDDASEGDCELDDDEKFLQRINETLKKAGVTAYGCGAIAGKGCKYDSYGKWKPRRSYALTDRYGRWTQACLRDSAKNFTYSLEVPLVVDVEWTCQFHSGPAPALTGAPAPAGSRPRREARGRRTKRRRS